MLRREMRKERKEKRLSHGRGGENRKRKREGRESV